MVILLVMLLTVIRLPANGALLTVGLNAHITESVATPLSPLVLRGIGAVATAGPLVSWVVLLSPFLL